jgi:hypothetical protein
MLRCSRMPSWPGFWPTCGFQSDQLFLQALPFARLAMRTISTYRKSGRLFIVRAMGGFCISYGTASGSPTSIIVELRVLERARTHVIEGSDQAHPRPGEAHNRAEVVQVDSRRYLGNFTERQIKTYASGSINWFGNWDSCKRNFAWRAVSRSSGSGSSRQRFSSCSSDFNLKIPTA